MFDSRLGKPTPKDISDYILSDALVNIISRDECKHMHETCSRLKVYHSTLCSKTQGMLGIRQPTDTTHY